ncbi:MAG: hypothetical protein MJZ82_00105 [Paludibacteraceae bacterium]|nr:hypothetical protein [Paludibacteraceae bacterium]
MNNTLAYKIIPHLCRCLFFTTCLLYSAGVKSEVRCDTLYTHDSIVIITTACAPICSSVARAYNKDGKFLGDLQSPFPDAIFPEAYIEDGQIRWRDNTVAILDEEEQNREQRSSIPTEKNKKGKKKK